MNNVIVEIGTVFQKVTSPTETLYPDSPVVSENYPDVIFNVTEMSRDRLLVEATPIFGSGEIVSYDKDSEGEGVFESKLITRDDVNRKLGRAGFLRNIYGCDTYIVHSNGNWFTAKFNGSKFVEEYAVFVSEAIVSTEHLPFVKNLAGYHDDPINDVSTILNKTWFHSSQNHEWESIPSETMVHVGTLQSAHDRNAHLIRDKQVPNTGGYWLYELELDSDTRIAKEKLFDPIDSWYDTWNPIVCENNDAFVYLNDYEDLGSESIYVRMEKVRVINKEWVNIHIDSEKNVHMIPA